jgi:glycerol-3-phosphate dehydrogenase
MPELERILIIGGGAGGALAHDLAQRGFRVTLVEKGELLSGASGRHHGLLHSGARYALHELEAARECRQESAILRRIGAQAVEPNGGLFAALDERDLSFHGAGGDRRPPPSVHREPGGCGGAPATGGRGAGRALV